jgi:hypothetical protein
LVGRGTERAGVKPLLLINWRTEGKRIDQQVGALRPIRTRVEESENLGKGEIRDPIKVSLILARKTISKALCSSSPQFATKNWHLANNSSNDRLRFQ